MVFHAPESGGVPFFEILAAEFQEVLEWICKSYMSLFFSHVILTKTLGFLWAIEIQAQLSQQMDL